MFRRTFHILGYLFTAFVLGMLFPESIYPTLTKALAPVMVGLAILGPIMFGFDLRDWLRLRRKG